jgi:hypothetical protein
MVCTYYLICTQLKAANPSASFGELAKIVSEHWKNVSSEEKATYEAMAKQVKLKAMK